MDSELNKKRNKENGQPRLPRYSCLSRRRDIVASIGDLTPAELAEGASHLRTFFARRKFCEVILSSFDAYPIKYQNETLEVKGAGQLRFNTEPEIWRAADTYGRFFSVSSLFRKELVTNALRRNSFLIVDFYQKGSPDEILGLFFDLLKFVSTKLGLRRLGRLAVEHAAYDARTDAPSIRTFQNRWVVTKGYTPANSFFEVDDQGESTRRELFLVTPRGFLEIGALGIVGTNRNPRYKLRSTAERLPVPPAGFSGMGIGLERFLLADRLLR